MTDFDLRYSDRVLAFHAFINTNRDPEPLTKELTRTVKGPKLDAAACWIEGYPDGAEVWAEMCRDRKIENNFRLRTDEGYRIITFHAYVNTESDPYHVHKAILRIARGPRLDACVCWAEIYEGEDGRKVWGVLQEMATKAAADPRSKPYSFGEDDRA